MNNFYDSTKPLKACEFKDLSRKIGVQVSEPFFHHGLKKNCVEIDRETITVNTATYGNNAVQADLWKPIAMSFTLDVIADIEKVIKELEQHKNRLAAEWHKLKKMEVK